MPVIEVVEDAIDSVGATWWFFPAPEVKNMMTVASQVLQDMIKDTKVEANRVTFSRTATVWEARYEFIRYNGQAQYFVNDKKRDNQVGIIDFCGGIPYGYIEIGGVIWEKRKQNPGYKVDAQDQKDAWVAPFPKALFQNAGDMAYYLLWLKKNDIECMQKDGIGGQTLKLHWWNRYVYQYKEDNVPRKNWPIPGGFAAYCVRVIPYLISGKQKSSPFMVSGNFIDTVYYTRGKIVSVKQGDCGTPYNTYQVQWHGSEDTVTAKPTDFTNLYKVGDWVCILKDVSTTRESQTWKDDQEFNQDLWCIAPIKFYEE